MDFNNELSAFQGAIISADNVHKFTGITSKGGNEEKVHYIIQSIRRFLMSESYIDENGLVESMTTKTRKFALYLVLNTDLTVISEMADMTELEPLIASIPLLPPYLMCEMMYQFHFEKFLYELIPNCWPQIGLEVAEAFLKHFKYFGPTECLHRLYKLSAACYALLCRLTCFEYEGDDNLTKKMLEDLVNTTDTFLKYFNDPPNKHRLNALSEDDLYKYKGKRFKNMLYLVYDCFNQFSEDYNPNCDDSLYRSTYNEIYLHKETQKVCDNPNKLAVESLIKTNTILLDSFKEITMDISVDVFCAWSEYEEDCKTMQQEIGELCDKVLRKLEANSMASEHPVMGMIKLMARKPTQIKDIINLTDTDTILQNINANNEESLVWIHALVNKEHLGTDKQLLLAVKSNLNSFDESECYNLYVALRDIPTTDPETGNILTHLKINLFHKCNVINKHKILKVHFRDKIFINTHTTDEDFEIKLNGMFNKFIADIDVDFTDVLTAFYQNPTKVMTKLFGLATRNSQLIEPMSKLMLLIKDYTGYFYKNETEPCMFRIIKFILNSCLQPNYAKNIVKFIHELKKSGIISNSQIMMLIVMPCTHAALLGGNVKRVYVQVQLLMNVFTTEELQTYRAPLLVMVGQVMELVRPRSLFTFQMCNLPTLELAIQFQKSLMNTYADEIPEKDVSWLKKKMQTLKMHPLNFYYFRRLWFNDRKNFFMSVTKLPPSAGMSLYVLSRQLTQTIPWAVVDEWCETWDNFIEGRLGDKLTMRIFLSAVDAVVRAMNLNRTPSCQARQLYIYGNLMHVTRYKYFKEPISATQIKDWAPYLCKILKNVDPLDVKDVENIIGPLLAYLSTRKDDFSLNVPSYFRGTPFFNIVDTFLPDQDIDDIIAIEDEEEEEYLNQLRSQR